jgi:hypothetical protein
MRKFEVTTDSGYKFVANLTDKSAREVAKVNQCAIFAIKDGVHENSIMQG